MDEMLAGNNKDRIDLFDELTLDLARGCVTRSGQVIHLRPQAYQVLTYLVENHDRLISKDKLIEEIWKGRAVTDGALGKCIEELRCELGPEAKKYLRTVRGRGYIFDSGAKDNLPSGTLTVVRTGVENHEQMAESTYQDGLPRPVATAGSRKKIRLATIVSAGIVILIVAIAVYRFVSSSASDARRITSIAVLTFTNESGNAEIDYLTDGMTETLINSVSQLPEMSVKARSTVFRYRGQPVDPQRIASELSVQAIVEGRVLQRDDELKVYVTLVDGGSGNQIWGRQYNRKLTELLALQDEIGRDVSRQLRTQPSGKNEHGLARSYTENVEAYQLYLRGRYHVLKLTRSEIQTGISYYQQAIEIDRNYALAYVGLAEAYRAFTLNGEMPPVEFLPQAKVAALKAIEIDESLAEAHTTLGSILFFFHHNWLEAENQFQRALELNPNDPDAHQFYANLLLVTGRNTEALSEAKQAQELDPLNVRISAIEGQLLIYAGHTDEGLTRLQKVFEVDPNFWFAHTFASSAYIDKGMFPEAVAEARKAKELSGASTYPAAFLGYALAKAGKRAEAHSVLGELLKMSKERYVHPYNIALIYNGLDSRQETLAWLERGYDQQDPRMVFLKVEPKWNNLLNDPRFRDLLERVGLSS